MVDADMEPHQVGCGYGYGSYHMDMEPHQVGFGYGYGYRHGYGYGPYHMDMEPHQVGSDNSFLDLADSNR